MTFLAPGFLVAAGLAALGVIGLHFLSTREPKLEPLPTARFVPEAPVRALSLTARLSDVLLLLLRVLLVLLVGAALAKPVWTEQRAPVARIVAPDISRAVSSPAEVADSARVYLDGASAVLIFDHAVLEVPHESASDSFAIWVEAGVEAGQSGEGAFPGSLSAAFIGASRAASRLRDRADSLELVIVSAFVEEQHDAATGPIRALWPGGVLLVQVAATQVEDIPEIDLEQLALKVRVEWADSGEATGWLPRTVPDTVGAVRAGDAVLVHPFVRAWRLEGELAGEGLIGPAGVGAAVPASAPRVYARWIDGEPAAMERIADGVCVRSLGFALPAEGDVLLRPEFQRFLAGLHAPCGMPSNYESLPAKFMAELAGPTSLASAESVARADLRTTPLMPWLLGAALLLALGELAARRRQRGSGSNDRDGGRKIISRRDSSREDSAGNLGSSGHDSPGRRGSSDHANSGSAR